MHTGSGDNKIRADGKSLEEKHVEKEKLEKKGKELKKEKKKLEKEKEKLEKEKEKLEKKEEELKMFMDSPAQLISNPAYLLIQEQLVKVQGQMEKVQGQMEEKEKQFTAMRSAASAANPMTRRWPEGERLVAALVNATEHVDKATQVMTVTLPDGQTFPRLDDSDPYTGALLVRKCVREVAQQVFDSVRLVNKMYGNPGIGKSWSLFYCLRELLKQEKDVIFELRKEKQTWIFQHTDDGYTCKIVDKAVPREAYVDLKNGAFSLVDPGKPDGGEVEPGWKGTRTILAMSPGRVSKEIAKGSHRSFYLPAWSLEELRAVREHLLVRGTPLAEEELRQAFNEWGGILRHIVSDGVETMEAERKTAVLNLSEADVLQLMKVAAGNQTIATETGMATFSHWIVQFAQDGKDNAYGLGNTKLVWTSDAAKELVVCRAAELGRQFSARVYVALQRVRSAGALRGHLFERLALNYVMASAEDNEKARMMYPLRKDSGPDRENGVPLEIGDGKTEELSTVDLRSGLLDTDPDDRTVRVPKARNFTVVDAFVGSAVGLQATVSESSHALKADRLLEILLGLDFLVEMSSEDDDSRDSTVLSARFDGKLLVPNKEKLDEHGDGWFTLCFLLPHDRFNTFKKQIYSFEKNEKNGDARVAEEAAREAKRKLLDGVVRQMAIEVPKEYTEDPESHS